MVLKLAFRASLARGNADHGWLKSFHTFSFANYYDPSFQSFGPLRVINEDRVLPTTGFGRHSHSEFEIFSYIVSGNLQHDDSMGNSESLKRGEIQMTTAGTGISHSEFNTHKAETVHFLQIWVKPNKARLTPCYTTKQFSDAEKQDTILCVVQDIDKAQASQVPIHADFEMGACLLTPGKRVTYTMRRNCGYLHLIMKGGYETPAKGAGRLLVNGQVMREGDGMFIDGAGDLSIESEGEMPAEFLLFDMRR